MYEFISGAIEELNPAAIIINNSGIGYYVYISLNTFSRLNGKKEVHLFIHQIVRDDAHMLYGFVDKNERELFRLLISVNGVGANTAIMMLSSLSPDEIRNAVASDNVNVLNSVKGIGLKTAQRIIIELKDKLVKMPESGLNFILSDNTIQNEALSALVMLGFLKKDAEKVVTKIVQEQPSASVENVIKLALKRL